MKKDGILKTIIKKIFNSKLFLITLGFIISSTALSLQNSAKEEKTKNPSINLKQVKFQELKGWKEDATIDNSIISFQRTCDYIAKQNLSQKISQLPGTIDGWKSVCDVFKIEQPKNSQQFRMFLESNMDPYLILSESKPDLLVTGYFHMTLQGSLKETDKYNTPIYARPDDLINVPLGEFFPELKGYRMAGKLKGTTLEPYYTRAEINNGALKNTTKVIAYANPVDIYFLQVQGSGTLTLEDGSTIYLAYDGTNGQPYTSIGNVLLKSKEILPPVNSSVIIKWINENPKKMQILFNENKSYIFFRETSSSAVVGAMNVPLIAGRSVAVDNSIIPLGSPLWLESTYPNSNNTLQRLVFAQDTGSAIKGLHVDYYWGTGLEAFTLAGNTNQKNGRLYILLPKNITLNN